MDKNKILQDIDLALRKDKKENHAYPDHICAMANRVSMKAGYLSMAADDFKYSPNNNEVVYDVQVERLYQDAVNVAAQAIRFIQNLKTVEND